MKKRYVIEQIYKVHIEYDFDDSASNRWNKVCDVLNFIHDNLPEDITKTAINRNYNPYFILESEDETELNLFISQILDYADSLGGFEIIE